MGLAALRHVASSQTRDQAHAPCIGRRILNHCATREVPHSGFELEEAGKMYLLIRNEGSGNIHSLLEEPQEARVAGDMPIV